MKKCTKCQKLKEENDFPKSKRFKSGFNSICKSCINLINKNYRINNQELFNESRRKNYKKNIEKNRKIKLEYTKSHRKEKSEYDEKYREINRERIKKYKKQWEESKKTDPHFKIKRNLRGRIRNALQGKKKSDQTMALIGCDYEYFKKHIESQFTEGMNWENYGNWHIDHIIPCYKFDLTNESQQKECFHYSNQRPLWAKDNLKRRRNI